MFKRNSQEFVDELGGAVLPRGGQVLAATRSIVVAEDGWVWENWPKAHVDKFSAFVLNNAPHVFGLGNVMRFMSVLNSHFARNYTESMKDVYSRIIPPSRAFME